MLELEAASWVLLTALLGPLFWKAARHARNEHAAAPLLVLLGLTVVARLAVPFAPPNWYMGTTEVGAFFTRATAVIPLPSRLALSVARDELGIRTLNLAFSLGSVLLFWFTAARAGHTRRTALVFAGFFALVPMYVRLAASDDGVVTALLFLFSVAAAARVELQDPGGAPWAWPLLALAIVLAMPLRLESGVLVPLVGFFGCRDRISWRGFFPSPAVAVTVLLATAVGAWRMLELHHQSMGVHAVNALGLANALIGGVLFIVNPAGPQFFSPLLAVPIWIFVVRRWRARDFAGLVALYVPVLLARVPTIFNDGPFVMLPAARYHVLSVVFILLASARAIDELPAWFARRPVRVAGALLLGPVAWVTLVVPGRFTYAYQEEYLFLRQALPREGTVVTLWDPLPGRNDLDCCLALPSQRLNAQFPGLRWVVLGAGVTEAELAAVSADFYYPGSMSSLDPSSLDVWWRKLVAPPETRALHRAHIARLRALDQQLRARFSPEPVAARGVPAHTFSDVGFRDDWLPLEFLARRQAR
ncbi:MAG: hypothetical protein Q8L48_08025 [Archangium sp.]|nr:hypothetical protein [Archangium sp.]